MGMLTARTGVLLLALGLGACGDDGGGTTTGSTVGTATTTSTIQPTTGGTSASSSGGSTTGSGSTFTTGGSSGGATTVGTTGPTTGVTTSASQGTTGPQVCDEEPDCAACEQCARNLDCANQFSNCVTDPDCGKLVACIMACDATDDSCKQGCYAASAGKLFYDPYAQCVFCQQCTTACTPFEQSFCG